MVRIAQPKLTPKQFRFAQAILQGDNQATAYRKAYDSKAKPAVIAVKAHHVRNHPAVEAYISQVLAKREEQSLLTRNKKREVLASIALHKRNKPSDRIAAIKVDNDMTGDAVTRVEEEITLGFILQRVTAPQIGLSAEEAALLKAKPVHAVAEPKEVIPSPVAESKAPAPVVGPFAADFAALDAAAPQPQRLERRRSYAE